MAMKTHLQKNYSGGNVALKFEGINHYQLVGNYEDDFDRFLKCNGYAGNSIDLLPYALPASLGCVVLYCKQTKMGMFVLFTLFHRITYLMKNQQLIDPHK